MARPKSKTNTDWKGFANVPFNAEARALYEAAEIAENVVYQRLEQLISTGYRVTFSYDKEGDTYQVSITCSAPKNANEGYTLTSRGPTWWDALSVATFKHFDLCQGVWPHGERVVGDKWG